MVVDIRSNPTCPASFFFFLAGPVGSNFGSLGLDVPKRIRPKKIWVRFRSLFIFQLSWQTWSFWTGFSPKILARSQVGQFLLDPKS